MRTETTGSQDRDFADRLFEQVSSNDILNAIKDLFHRDASWALDWVRENFTPDEIFSSKELAQWAETNGYS